MRFSEVGYSPQSIGISLSFSVAIWCIDDLVGMTVCTGREIIQAIPEESRYVYGCSPWDVNANVCLQILFGCSSRLWVGSGLCRDEIQSIASFPS